MPFRDLYHRCVDPETRYWIYKQRHREEFKRLRNADYPSEKGDFSLRPFDEKQCIFVHITKTAGTSIALSLFGKLPYHYTASEYRVIFGRKDFNRFFKFCFVRNPWDRLYSAFNYLKAGGWNAQDKQWAINNLAGVDDFNDFVLHWLTAEKLDSHLHFLPQARFICDKRGKPLLDFYARFESIQSDYDLLANAIGAQSELKNTNRGSARASYRSTYLPESIDRVRQLYHQDIKLLGYGFDEYQDILPRRLPQS